MIWNLQCNEYILSIHLHFDKITITEVMKFKIAGYFNPGHFNPRLCNHESFNPAFQFLLVNYSTINFSTLDYIRYKITLCIYLFPRKILPCAALFHNSTETALWVYLFLEKIQCTVRLFHTVRLLDSPEYPRLLNLQCAYEKR